MEYLVILGYQMYTNRLYETQREIQTSKLKARAKALNKGHTGRNLNGWVMCNFCRAAPAENAIGDDWVCYRCYDEIDYEHVMEELQNL